MLLKVAVMSLSYWVCYTVVSPACLHVRGDTPDISWHSSKVSGFSSSALLSPLASLAMCFMVTAVFQGNSEKLLSPCTRHMTLWDSSSVPLCPSLSCIEPKGCCFLSPVTIVSLNMKKWGRNLKDSQGNKAANEFWFQCSDVQPGPSEWQFWVLLMLFWTSHMKLCALTDHYCRNEILSLLKFLAQRKTKWRMSFCHW